MKIIYTLHMQLDRRLFEGKIKSSIVYPSFFPITASETVVNVGCGIGPQAVAYKGQYREMVGVDLNRERLEMSKILLKERGVQNYRTVCAPVEKTGLPAQFFDKALAIDIIEHLSDPDLFLQEVLRLLKPGGTLLLTIPAMHDHYVHAFRSIGKLFGRKTKQLPEGHLDAHNSSYSVSEWRRIIRRSGFQVVRTRASTLWPPLHLYGISRFWFTNPVIRIIDDLLCQLPILKRFGQAYLMVLRKKDSGIISL